MRHELKKTHEDALAAALERGCARGFARIHKNIRLYSYTVFCCCGGVVVVLDNCGDPWPHSRAPSRQRAHTHPVTGAGAQRSARL